MVANFHNNQSNNMNTTNQGVAVITTAAVSAVGVNQHQNNTTKFSDNYEVKEELGK